MKHLVEFLKDNNAPLTEKQELLIIDWLDDVKMNSENLASGMTSHIKDRLFREFLTKQSHE